MNALDLQPGDMLDLENLAFSGADGISAECEFAVVEDVDGEVIYTDLRNLRVARGAEVEVVDPRLGAYRFKTPADVVKTWTW